MEDGSSIESWRVGGREVPEGREERKSRTADNES